MSVTSAKLGFADLERKLEAAANKDNPVTADSLSTDVIALTATLERLIPNDWRRADPAGDLDVIRQQLKQIENAAGERSYDLAESARIGFFQPQLASEIESLFWNGLEPAGFARLIAQQANAAEFRITRVALEAVLILTALLGSLKAPAVRHLRRPLWLGALASFGATIVTFMVMVSILNAFAAYGEKLSAVVSVIAVAVLLVIMNWFSHNVYWNDHLANFHKKMLIATGGMICVVLFVIVGNTVHMLQVVGWMTIHPLPITLPYWAGLWLGTFATWEGVLLQILAVSFVLGSYFIAEGLKHRQQNRRVSSAQAADRRLEIGGLRARVFSLLPHVGEAAEGG